MRYRFFIFFFIFIIHRESTIFHGTFSVTGFLENLTSRLGCRNLPLSFFLSICSQYFCLLLYFGFVLNLFLQISIQYFLLFELNTLIQTTRKIGHEANPAKPVLPHVFVPNHRVQSVARTRGAQALLYGCTLKFRFRH